jgi:hypothetical protein
MFKKLLLVLLLSLCLGSTAFANFFDYLESGYDARVFVERFGDGAQVSLATVATDSEGSLYYFSDDSASVIAGKQSINWAQMQQTMYTVTISKLRANGMESVFAQKDLPLNASIEGILFDTATRRLLIFVKTLEVDEVTCPFIAASLFTLGSGSKTTNSGEQTKGGWSWSGLENCFTQRFSVVEVTGFRSNTPAP